MNLHAMMRQAQAMKQKMDEAQKRIQVLEVEGISGGGMVCVRLEGSGRMRGVTINPALLVADDVEVLEDLLVAAHNDAMEKLDKQKAYEMGEVMGDAPEAMNMLMA